MGSPSDAHGLRDGKITEQILGSAFEVSNELGVGFLERVYENALIISLRERHLLVESQIPLSVTFHGKRVADLLVKDRVLIELKFTKALNDEHLAQCMNYLRATRLQTCLLLNFCKPRLEYKRVSL